MFKNKNKVFFKVGKNRFIGENNQIAEGYSKVFRKYRTAEDWPDKMELIISLNTSWY